MDVSREEVVVDNGGCWWMLVAVGLVLRRLADLKLKSWRKDSELVTALSSVIRIRHGGSLD
jgi:hypothetical protein